MSKRQKWQALAVSVGLVAAMGSAHAVTIGGGLVNGPNSILDESREAYVDANSNGLFDVGDVIFGYIRISDFQPSGTTGNNQVYGVFSQQVAAGSAGRNVIFQPTTYAPLTLAALLGGDPNVNASAIAAFYDRSSPFIDLINDPAPTNTKMQDYINYIRSAGTLQLVAGFDGVDDFLFSEITLQMAAFGIAVGGSNAGFANPLLDNGYTVAGNYGAFTFSYNNTGLIFNPVDTVNPLAGLVFGDITVSSGTTEGANSVATLPQPKGWLSAGGESQCGVDTAGAPIPCGFINKNNFSVDVSRVPEPASLALLSVAMLAAGGFAKRRKPD